MDTQTLGEIDQSHGQDERRDAESTRRREDREGARSSEGTVEEESNQRSNLWVEVFKLAGIVGVDPHPLTLRELCWMAHARIEADWWHTANLMSLTINQNRKKGSRAITPKELHPMQVQKQKKAKKQIVGVEALKAFLPPNDPNRKGFELGKT